MPCDTTPSATPRSRSRGEAYVIGRPENVGRSVEHYIRAEAAYPGLDGRAELEKSVAALHRELAEMQDRLRSPSGFSTNGTRGRSPKGTAEESFVI